MVSKEVITGFVLATMLAAGPAAADDQHHRAGSQQESARQTERARPAQQARPEQRNDGRERAVPRTAPNANNQQRSEPQRRSEQPRYVEPQRRNDQPRYVEPQRRNDQPRYVEPQRRNDQPRYVEPERRNDQPRYVEPQRRNDQPRYVEPQRRNDQPRYVEPQRRDDQSRYAVPRRVEPRRDSGAYRGAPYYAPRIYRGSPRIIRPSIVTVAPYRPYVYRPSWSIGVYYGSDGYYPYGYTPRAYYDPIPGRPYGGLRITGMPRDAQVFADGYYVGIVNDFDGIFQHLNLEAGPHHIEIQFAGGYEAPLAFDLYIEPGRTTTYRATY